MRKNASLAALFFSMLLGGCGGGDHGSLFSVPPTQSVSVSVPSQSEVDVSVPLHAAVANEVKSGFTVNLSMSGTVAGSSVTGSGTLTVDAGVLGNFNGIYEQLQIKDRLATAITGDNLLYISERYVLRNLDTYAETREYWGGGTAVVFPDYTYPSSVKAGDSGTFVTGDIVGRGSLDRVGTLSLSYSVTADSESSLFVAFIRNEFDNSSVKVADEKRTYRIDTSGQLQFVSLNVRRFINSNYENSLTYVPIGTP